MAGRLAIIACGGALPVRIAESHPDALIYTLKGIPSSLTERAEEHQLEKIGTLFAAISVNTHSREVMLPILLFPVSVPIILAAVKSTAVLLQGGALGDAAGWLRLLIVFDVVFAVVCFLLYEYVLVE